MNKLTLPIEAGKKYIQRNGKVTTPVPSAHSDMVLIHNEQHLYEQHLFKKNGRASNNTSNLFPHDLVSDYVEQVQPKAPAVTGHVHAASMVLYAQDALEVDNPWERWEYKNETRTVFEPIIRHPAWTILSEYRRKPPAPVFININGFQVPEPMRATPVKGSEYWYVELTTSVISSRWDGYKADDIRLNKGLCHTTKEAAQLHSNAILSFTESK